MFNQITSENRTAIQVATSRRIYDIVSTVAYLIGVSESTFERSMLKEEIYHQLDTLPGPRTVRTLCRIRTALMRNYDGIAYGLYNMRNLNRLHEFFDPEWFEYLSSQNIHFVKANYKVSGYIAEANRYLLEHISTCRDCFPTWLEWGFIKELFLMPEGAKETGIRKALAVYSQNLNDYPFQMYLNWLPSEQGNILLHDGKFVHLLYQLHGLRFTDINKIQDAGTYIKDGLLGFISGHEAIVMMVDCENSDPYKFYAAMKSIAAHCGDMIQHICKIVLFDDVHTASAWSVLHRYIDIPVERKLIKRVAGHKSLVDITLAADACKEVYMNDVGALIIASSDSDFWGLLTALSKASFYIMMEYEKCGGALKAKLAEASIPYCFMDSFAGGRSGDLKEGALITEVKALLEHSAHLNIRSMLAEAYNRTRVSMSDAERRQFENGLLRKLRLEIDQNGDVSITV